MAWSIEFSKAADRDFGKLDKPVQTRIFRYLYERIANCADPRAFGKPLQHDLSGLWRYRVGDHRIVCRLEDDKLIVLVVEIGHRSSVYD